MPNLDAYRPLPQNRHTHTQNHNTALWILSGTTRVSRYLKKHSPTHTHRGHQISISASSIYYNPWHPPYSVHALYSLLPLSLSKLCLVYLNLFCCSSEIMSCNPSLSLNSLLGTLSCNFTPHMHLTIHIFAL